MLLHTVSASPFSSPRLSDAINASIAGDAILLMGNAVYAATKISDIAATIDNNANVTWYVIEEDCHIRGIAIDALHPSATCIGYDKFVELVIAADSTIAW
jgi:tRNA 2-thiouridine synthesizing protein B